MSTSVTPRPTTRATPWRVIASWAAVPLAPVAVVVGVLLAYGLGLDPSVENPLVGWDAVWRVVIVWLIVVSVSVIGVVLGVAARRRHEVSATAAVVVNGLLLVALTFMTLGEGLIDAFR